MIPAGQSYSEKAVQEDIDKGRRAADIINALRVAHPWEDIKDKWVAISLADGSCDGEIYDTRADAIKHQKYEQQCCYISFRNLMGGITAKDAAIFIHFAADAYRAGMRLIDPDTDSRNPNAGTDLIIPTSGWDSLKRNMDRRLMAAATRRIERGR